MAIALIVVNFFEIFRDLGIGPALIHRKEERGVAADTAFYIFPAVALIFYAVAYFIAPTAAGSLIMVTLVLLLSIGLGAVSYLVFIWLTQKEELREIRRLIDGGRGL